MTPTTYCDTDDMSPQGRLETADDYHSSNNEAEYIDLKKAMCSGRFRYATVIGVCIACMAQISGINLMTCYSFTIFDLVGVPPVMGSILFAVVGVLGSLVSPFVLRL